LRARYWVKEEATKVQLRLLLNTLSKTCLKSFQGQQPSFADEILSIAAEDSRLPGQAQAFPLGCGWQILKPLLGLLFAGQKLIKRLKYRQTLRASPPAETGLRSSSSCPAYYYTIPFGSIALSDTIAGGSIAACQVTTLIYFVLAA
jgi:hypothetical protein